MKRRRARAVHVGQVTIGGDSPVTIQSMTCTPTADVTATVAQIRQLEEAGCEIVRVAVPDEAAARALPAIKNAIQIPLVADIHFNHRLALLALEACVDKIRINPGNIGSEDRVRTVLREADDRRIPIRIGVNAGSLDKDLIQQFGGVTAEALAESAMQHVRICQDFGFTRLVISVKASDVPMMIAANRILAGQTDYPLHLGVTEAGTPKRGVLRSAVGIGALLAQGIGDTIRVSLTGDPVQEVDAGFEILKSLHLRAHGLTIVSCPTCGRTQANLVKIVEAVEKALAGEKKNLTLAIMGCAVNGPGEAKEADLGVACGKGDALFFKKGEVVGKIREEDIISTLIQEVNQWSEIS